MMIVPLPAFLLDLLISLNIAIAVTMLLIAIHVADGLKIATFPSLLLLSTLFRLAIEVSATRLILLKANAGQVIYAFGSFVVASNLVVGLVVFIILTAVQFIVVAKGAERVAEVGARFTLDALPGKQMAIDAELRGGHIDLQEAQEQRQLLGRESQFFGAMDGAMKFVKGDAIAGIVILLTNLVGGLVVGVLQRGMELSSALHTYALLTIGEGLVAQIPALLISTAAGIVVTRVSSDEDGAHLGGQIAKQVLAQPKALAFSAALLTALALVPGLPAVPFLLLAAVLGLVAYRLIRRDPKAEASINGPLGPANARGAELLIPLRLDLSPDVTKSAKSRLSRELLPALRNGYFDETGIPLAAVQVRESSDLAAGAYAIRLHEAVIASGQVTVWTTSPTSKSRRRLLLATCSGCCGDTGTSWSASTRPRPWSTSSPAPDPTWFARWCRSCSVPSCCPRSCSAWRRKGFLSATWSRSWRPWPSGPRCRVTPPSWPSGRGRRCSGR